MRIVKVQGLYVGDYDLKGKKIEKLVLVSSLEKAMVFDHYEDDLMCLAFQLDGEIVHGEKKFVVEKTEDIKDILNHEDDDDCCCEICC